MSKHDYHGQAASEEHVPGAPPVPDTFRPSGPPRRTPSGVFAIVRFKGNYGLLCGQYQEFERRNISHEEARQIAWSSFGVCGHTVTYLDAGGNLLFEEH